MIFSNIRKKKQKLHQYERDFEEALAKFKASIDPIEALKKYMHEHPYRAGMTAALTVILLSQPDIRNIFVKKTVQLALNNLKKTLG